MNENTKKYLKAYKNISDPLFPNENHILIALEKFIDFDINTFESKNKKTGEFEDGSYRQVEEKLSNWVGKANQANTTLRTNQEDTFKSALNTLKGHSNFSVIKSFFLHSKQHKTLITNLQSYYPNNDILKHIEPNNLNAITSEQLSEVLYTCGFLFDVSPKKGYYKAINYYQLAIAINPNHHKAKLHLAKLYKNGKIFSLTEQITTPHTSTRSLKQRTELGALKQFQVLSNSASEAPQSIKQAANAAQADMSANKKDINNAIKLYKEALTHKDSAQINKHIMQLYERKGDHAMAIVYRKKPIKDDTPPRTRWDMAYSLARQSTTVMKARLEDDKAELDEFILRKLETTPNSKVTQWRLASMRTVPANKLSPEVAFLMAKHYLKQVNQTNDNLPTLKAIYTQKFWECLNVMVGDAIIVDDNKEKIVSMINDMLLKENDSLKGASTKLKSNASQADIQEHLALPKNLPYYENHTHEGKATYQLKYYNPAQEKNPSTLTKARYWIVSTLMKAWRFAVSSVMVGLDNPLSRLVNHSNPPKKSSAVQSEKQASDEQDEQKGLSVNAINLAAGNENQIETIQPENKKVDAEKKAKPNNENGM